MGDNEEHLCFMLLLDNYVQKKRRHGLRNTVNKIYEEILREFLAMFLMKIW